MGRRGEQHEAARLSGIGQRECRRLGRAERMADDDRLADAELVHQRGERSCLAERRLVAGAALGPAMARPVEEQQLGAASSNGLSGTIWSFRLALAPWMKTIGGRSGFGRRRHMHEMHARAVGGRERADRRVAPLDQPGADPRDPGQHEHQGKQEIDRGEDDVHAYRTIRGNASAGSCGRSAADQMPSPASSSESVATSFWALRIIG